MSTPLIRLWYAVIALVVSCLVIAGISVQYSNYVDRKSNQRWCELLATMDDAYKANPPRTDAGQRMAAELRRLRVDFGCANFDPKEGS